MHEVRLRRLLFGTGGDNRDYDILLVKQPVIQFDFQNSANTEKCSPSPAKLQKAKHSKLI